MAEIPAVTPKKKLKLGLDNFAVRAMKWKAPQLVDYAARLKTDSLFITDFAPFEKFEDDYLRDTIYRKHKAGFETHLHRRIWADNFGPIPPGQLTDNTYPCYCGLKGYAG